MCEPQNHSVTRGRATASDAKQRIRGRPLHGDFFALSRVFVCARPKQTRNLNPPPLAGHLSVFKSRTANLWAHRFPKTLTLHPTKHTLNHSRNLNPPPLAGHLSVFKSRTANLWAHRFVVIHLKGDPTPETTNSRLLALNPRP